MEIKTHCEKNLDFIKSALKDVTCVSALTFSYNPKDLKFIHHITDEANLHQVKRQGCECVCVCPQQKSGQDMQHHTALERVIRARMLFPLRPEIDPIFLTQTH